MQGKSLFDVNSFLETIHKGNLDTAYVLPDVGDYLAQITDKIDVRSGLIDSSKQRGGEPWASVDIQWEIMDDAVRAKLNMEHVYVRQSFLLDLNGGNQLDLGVNKNMRLKRLWDATGINKSKQVSIGMLKFQSGLIHVEHRPDPNDAEIQYAEVTRVTAPERARQREAAQ